jgi:hypothetical protein
MTTQQIKSLQTRLETQREELAECTTAAMRQCVAEAIADTERQLGYCPSCDNAYDPIDGDHCPNCDEA